MGYDPVAQTDYEYHRDWRHQMEQLLAGQFAVEAAFHTEISNHIHLVLRNRPDVAADWDDEDVVSRWLIIAKLKRNGNATIVEPTPAEIARELNKPGRVEVLRRRLASVARFMGTLCENIARRFNIDAETSGTLWEHRFKCRRLADETPERKGQSANKRRRHGSFRLVVYKAPLAHQKRN